MQKGSQEDIPQILHLSSHPGYNIKRPQELLQDYGDHMLSVLMMVKRGLISQASVAGDMIYPTGGL